MKDRINDISCQHKNADYWDGGSLVEQTFTSSGLYAANVIDL